MIQTLTAIAGRSEVFRNMLVLAPRTAIASVIPIAVSPVLCRLYSPEQFGTFAAFLSVASVLATIATARYELASMLPKGEQKAATLVQVAVSLAFCTTVVVAIVILWAREPLAIWMKNLDLANWLLLVPIYMFVVGSYQTLACWLNRQGLYAEIARARIAQASAVALATIGLGIFWAGPGGLILGCMVGQALALILVFKCGFRSLAKATQTTLPKLRDLAAAAWRYKDFAVQGTPALLVSACAGQMLVLLVFRQFGSNASGQLVLLDRMFGVFALVIGKNIGDLYYRRLSHGLPGQAWREVKVMTMRLGQLSLLAHLAIYLVIEFLLVIIFGEQWVEAIAIGRFLVIVSFFSAIFAPLTTLFNYYRVQGLNLLWQATWLITDVVVFACASHYELTFSETIVIYSAKQTILYATGIVGFLWLAYEHHRATCQS